MIAIRWSKVLPSGIPSQWVYYRYRIKKKKNEGRRTKIGPRPRACLHFGDILALRVIAERIYENDN